MVSLNLILMTNKGLYCLDDRLYGKMVKVLRMTNKCLNYEDYYVTLRDYVKTNSIMKYRKIQFFEYQKGVDIVSSTIEGAIADVDPKYYSESPHKCVREMILAED